MSTNLKCPVLSGLNTLIVILIAGVLIGALPIFDAGAKKAEANFGASGTREIPEGLEERTFFLQENSLLPVSVSSVVTPDAVPSRQLKIVTVTAYSSTVDQTDSDPFITAAGTTVRDGIVATNVLPFGTKIRLPELYGDQIFVVEDRMHPRNGSQIDIWFPERWQALDFGVKRTYIEILEG